MTSSFSVASRNFRRLLSGARPLLPNANEAGGLNLVRFAPEAIAFPFSLGASAPVPTARLLGSSVFSLSSAIRHKGSSPGKDPASARCTESPSGLKTGSEVHPEATCA